MSFRRWSIPISAILMLPVGAANAAPEEEPAVWQAHHVQFDYFGITARFTCDGLEYKVRQILEYLGARSDAIVTATGCPRGPESISRSAFVQADFNTLALSTGSGDSAATTAAVWTQLNFRAQRPNFLGDGDCELIDQMRKVLTDNFSWRGKVAYRTDCPIETIEFRDFQIQGELLQPVPKPAH